MIIIEGPWGAMQSLPRSNVLDIIKKHNLADDFIIIFDDTTLSISLRGTDKRDKNNVLIENWVDFIKVSINGKDIISKITPVWHNKPYVYTLEAKKGDILNLYAEWKKHETKD